MAEKVPGFDTPFYRRFLNQKGGAANIFFTACVCVLSVRVMTCLLYTSPSPRDS